MGKKSITDAIRWQIVAYFKLDFKKSKIVELLKISYTCVSTTISDWLSTGNVKERNRRGRPRTTSAKDDSVLFRLTRKDPNRSFLDLNQLWSVNGTQIASPSTVRRRLLEFGIESHTAVDRPSLTKAHMAKRLLWCEEHKDWGYDMWSTVIFSDESNFKMLNRKVRPVVKRFPYEKFRQNMICKKKQGGGGSIGIWGCITIMGTGTCDIYTGRINSERYIDVLENNLVPSVLLIVPEGNDWTFQQDNASAHKSKKIMKYLRENNIDTMEWPANSPDLNPIETLWKTLDCMIAKDPPCTMAELEQNLSTYWNKITTRECINCIESLPERIEKCIKARGGHFEL